MVATDLGTTSDVARALVIQPDNRIVVAGTAGGDVALARYRPDGELDDAFGDHGTRITDLGSDDFANGVALDAEGRILVAGHTLGDGVTLDFALARYSAGGELDESFGAHGLVTTDVGGGDDFAESLTVQRDGRIVVVGRATSPTILDLAVVRYRDDGTPDTSFGTGGTITADFHGGGEFGQDVAIQPDGRIVAAGYTANGRDTEFALMRIMTRVVCTADIHEHLPEIPECDLLLIAGDVSFALKGDLASEHAFLEGPFAEWLERVPAAETVLIAGNHDQSIEAWGVPAGLRCHYLEDAGAELCGLKGLGHAVAAVVLRLGVQRAA